MGKSYFSKDIMNEGVFILSTRKEALRATPTGEKKVSGWNLFNFLKGNSVAETQEAKIRMNRPSIRMIQPGQIACTRSRSLKKRTPTASVTGISICFTAST